MVAGDREYPAGVPLPEAADDSAGLRLRALIVLIACAVAVAYTVTQVR